MKNVYCIYDRVSEQYLYPEVHENDGVAIRVFVMSCANPEIPEYYLNDITLVCIGNFDECTGAITPVIPRNVFFGNAIAIKDLRKQYKEAMTNDQTKEE